MASAEEARTLGCSIPDVDHLFEELEKVTDTSTARRKASDFEEITPAYLAGLNLNLIQLAERYVGLPPLYLGIEAKVEFPDGGCRGTRKWHFDAEDLHVLKIVTYLSNVDHDDGPMEYIPFEESARLRKMGLRPGFHEDHEIVKNEVKECVGSTGTTIIFDGALLLHRAKPPTTKPRKSIMYSYVSRRPRQIFAGARPTKAVRSRLPDYLTEEQLGCIP